MNRKGEGKRHQAGPPGRERLHNELSSGRSCQTATTQSASVAWPASTFLTRNQWLDLLPLAEAVDGGRGMLWRQSQGMRVAGNIVETGFLMGLVQ